MNYQPPYFDYEESIWKYPNPPKKVSKKIQKTIIVGGLAGLLGALSYGIAYANTNPASQKISLASSSANTSGPSTPISPPNVPTYGFHDMRGVIGKVTAVSPTSISIKSPNSTAPTTFVITGSTTISEDGSSSTVSAIQAGDIVSIQLTSTSSNTASRIDVRQPSLGGKVVTVGSNSIVVEDQQGFYRTIDVSASTTYKSGNSTSSLAQVSVGSQVVAFGSVDSNHIVLDATSVDIILPHVGGTVTQVNGSDITVKGFNGSTEVITTNSSTVFKSFNATSASISSVTVGSNVVAEGTPTSNGISADQVDIMPAFGGRHHRMMEGGPNGGLPGGPGGMMGGPRS